MARLHAGLGPDEAIDQHVVSEELGQRRRSATGEDIRRQIGPLTGDEVVIEGVTRESRIEELAGIPKHAILHGVAELVGIGGQPQGIVWLAGVSSIPDR